jgi:hypothetical protein
LAYSCGPAHAIYIQDFPEDAALRGPPQELRGAGSTPFDLGFSNESHIVGFTRARLDAANLPGLYEGFDLDQHRSRIVPRDQLPHRAIREHGGWTLEPAPNPPRLEAAHADGRRWRVELDPATERLAWSWTLVPPGPGHPRPTTAVGTEAGVALFDLETGRRTRAFTGHSAPVVSLAPAPDGRWLASSSLDQTVMLYPLAGCDTRPGLGATFRPGPTAAGWSPHSSPGASPPPWACKSATC